MTQASLEQQLLSRFVAEEIDCAMFLLDPDGNISSWNAGAERIFGYSEADILGSSFAALYPPGEQEAKRPTADLALARGSGRAHDEGWRVRKDGSEFFTDTTVQALCDDDGTLHGYGVLSFDITGRRASEEALLQREQHLRSILATIPDAMIVIDERGNIILFSTAAQKLFGYTEDEVAGRNVAMLMPSPDHERHDEYIRHYCETGERRIIGIGRVVTGRRKDGSNFPLELSVGETRTDGHRIFTGFIRDLTEHRQHELRVKELQAELVHVSRVSAMGTMASTLAHELNQPLAAIANYMEAARDLIDAGDPDPELIREATAESASEALRAGKIVRRLREFVSRGEIDKHVEDLTHLIDEASRLALTGATERSIRTFFRLSPDAPQVFGSRIQIQQVLVNLIRNAIDALSDAPVREITVTTEAADDDMVKISVADTGAGIDPEFAPRLFEAFASTKQSGMGLGLSICRTIVEAHGGRIWAGPRPGGGTVMSFTLFSGETHE
ncbi:PAS domain S-box protein [Stakelama marina]|uniref:Sensor protein FixL n=1 Tax=Stakelama marina TaxID=2826939 RepID=A0A8T4IA85_9SPHN|nr:PAS domain S-box protein [Stakelama marina]MBR0551271.1 PAS domain S-box protein [Stakelama marina]